jgi:broad specificity phosphatase PhoE
LSSLYLIRHGQAGTRDRYDELSALGRQQAYLCGQYLAAQKVQFRAFIAGRLNRQQQTAQEMWRAYREAGFAAPEIVVDEGWNEFDMTAVFNEFAPRLCEADPQFRQDYDALMRALEDTHSPIHHAWTECDTQAMRAWMEGRYPCLTETWAAFSARVLGRRESLAGYGSGDSVAVFTSACPVGIWVANALGVSDGQIMRLAGVLYNAAVTTLRLRDGGTMLFTFNSVSHLSDPRQRTFR